MNVLFVGSSEGYLDQRVIDRLNQAMSDNWRIFVNNDEGFDLLVLQYLKRCNYRKVTVYNSSFSDVNLGYEMFNRCTEWTMVNLADRVEVYGSAGNYMDMLLTSIPREKIYVIC